MTAAFWAGGFVDPAGPQNSSGNLDDNHDGHRYIKPRMSGGRCHDHRLMSDSFPAPSEREIFGL